MHTHICTYTRTVSFFCAAEKMKKNPAPLEVCLSKMKLLAALQAFEGIENSFLQSPHRQVQRRVCVCLVRQFPPGGLGNILCSFLVSC